MAFIGLRHVVAAPITAETEGQPITYGTGAVIGKGIQANLTINRGDNPLYADDGEAEGLGAGAPGARAIAVAHETGAVEAAG